MSVTLRGITWEHERGFDCMVASSGEYSRLRPHVRVEWTFRSLQAFADAPVEELATIFDLLVLDHPHIPLAADNLLLARLDGAGCDDELEALASESVGASHQSYAYSGHQYGVATDAAAQVAVHRPDKLREVPTAWDEVLELAGEGRVLWPAKPIDAYSSLLTLAANNGTPAFCDTGGFLRSDDAMPVLDLLHRLTERVPEFCLSANPIDIAEALSSDAGWSYCPLAFGYTNYSRSGYRPFRLAYTDIPVGACGVTGSLLGGAGLSVSAHSAHIAEARAFALWTASSATQRGVYFESGGQPGNAAAWDDERLNAETLGFFRNTRKTLEGAFVRPRTPAYIRFQDTVSPWVTDVLRGELSDERLIARMNEEAMTMAVTT